MRTSIASLIERIAGRQRERQAARAADFRSLVARIADGQGPDADTVDRVLQDAGKSLDDLRQAVERLQHEQRAAEFDAEVAKVEKRIAKLQRDADAVRQRMLVP